MFSSKHLWKKSLKPMFVIHLSAVSVTLNTPWFHFLISTWGLPMTLVNFICNYLYPTAEVLQAAHEHRRFELRRSADAP